MTVGTKVYDVTDFLDDHPGGGNLILDYAGKDIEAILKDSDSHQHSEAAYDVLDDSLIGFVVPETALSADKGNSPNIGAQIDGASDVYVHPRTGMSCEDDLSKDTDASSDYKKHQFLDLSRPLFPQIWFGGFSKEFYLDQVHRPRHYKGGQSAPLFGNFLEPLSKTPWWVVPMVWVPCVAYAVSVGLEGLGPFAAAGYFGVGLAFWTLIEYFLHRFLFHLD